MLNTDISTKKHQCVQKNCLMPGDFFASGNLLAHLWTESNKENVQIEIVSKKMANVDD